MEPRTHSSAQEESAIIERVARIVSSVRGTKPDYTRLAAELEQAVPFDIFGVVLLRHDREAVRVTVCQRVGSEWDSNYLQLPVEASMFHQLMKAPLLTVKDYPNGVDGLPSTSGDALSGHPQLHSTLIAPLVVEDRILGSLELGSVVAHIYDNKDLQRLINAVVQVLANAIDSAQIGGKAEIQDRQSKVLQEVSTALASKTELSTILNQIVVGITESLQVASAIFMLDHRDNSVCIQAQSGLDMQKLNKIFCPCRPVSERCIIGQTLLRLQPLVSQNIAEDQLYPESSSFFKELGMHSIFSYPLVTGTTPYGALLLFSPEPGGFTPLKSEILSLFANQATIAIHNGMLLEAAQQRSRLQEAIERLEDEERSRPSWERLQYDLSLLEHVRQETRRVFGVSFTTLLRYVIDNLPTQSERDLQTDISQRTRTFGHVSPGSSALSSEPDLLAAGNLSLQDRPNPVPSNLALLTKTAEAALESAGSVGELSRLLLQFKQSATWVKDAWFVVDLQGACTYINPSAEALCGTRLDAMTAHSQMFMDSPKHAAFLPIEQVFEKLLPRIRNAYDLLLYLQDFADESSGRRELRCVLAVEPVHSQPVTLHSLHMTAGEYHPLQVESASSDYHYQFTRYPLYNAQGRLVMHALQVHDATEQVRDEKNQSALLSAVSHDLRTPLTIIKGAVSGLLHHDVVWSEEDRHAMLEDIDNEADHLTVLVGALVEMSRISMGALVLEKEWCDINEIVHGALARMKRATAGRVIRVLSQPAQLPLVYVDHVQLERVFCNLIENAVRHAPVDKEILVQLDIINDGMDMLRIQVIDYGSGVPISERERIFKSFYSLRSYGNGLGLAICKGIIDSHEGHIWMDVASDGGACVVFTLPFCLHTHTPGSENVPASIHGTAREE